MGSAASRSRTAFLPERTPVPTMPSLRASLRALPRLRRDVRRMARERGYILKVPVAPLSRFYDDASARLNVMARP